MQSHTHGAGRRPFGLGLLVVGHDVTGPCLYETCPSGQFWQCKAMALGARSQAAKTYLERKLDEFAGASADDLVTHALLALQVCFSACFGHKSVLVLATNRAGLLLGRMLAPFGGSQCRYPLCERSPSQLPGEQMSLL